MMLPSTDNKAILMHVLMRVTLSHMPMLEAGGSVGCLMAAFSRTINSLNRPAPQSPNWTLPRHDIVGFIRPTEGMLTSVASDTVQGQTGKKS